MQQVEEQSEDWYVAYKRDKERSSVGAYVVAACDDEVVDGEQEEQEDSKQEDEDEEEEETVYAWDGNHPDCSYWIRIH